LAKNAKMPPLFYDSTRTTYSFDDEEKNNNNKKDEKEIYMVVIMMHVTLLLVCLRLNYSPPSHSEIFFFI
jgi:hypothetical protein